MDDLLFELLFDLQKIIILLQSNCFIIILPPYFYTMDAFPVKNQAYTVLTTLCQPHYCLNIYNNLLNPSEIFWGAYGTF